MNRMLPTFPLEQTLIVVAALLLLSVFASKMSARMGVPALVLFIVIGMLAGAEGPGGIAFEDAQFAQAIGTVALAFILFAGGLDTDWPLVRPIVWRGIALSTLGVLFTTLFVGLFAHYVLGFGLLVGLLLGAIVSSTDAAAVFGVLRTRRIALKHRLTPLLELESGTNDPMAVFLTLALTSAAVGGLVSPGAFTASLIESFALQMTVGGAIGLVFGHAAVWLVNHLRLEYDGLYPAVTLAVVCVTFGGAQYIGGNGFLAVYVVGLVMGSRNFLHKIGLIQFHDGLAWLMQIAMFLALGLLVNPSQLVPVLGIGLLLSFFLMLLGRPAAVFLSLLFARMRKRDRFFVSWAGLRGAVPIILATFPLIAGVPEAPLLFNIVFFVVLSSVAVQGTTLGLAARWLNVAVQPHVEPGHQPSPHRDALLEVAVAPGSHAAYAQVVNLGLPRTALLVLLQRGEETFIPRGSTVVLPGDVIHIATRKEDRDQLRALFEGVQQSILPILDEEP
jgi:potassium/hydrogen antiporter